MTEKNQNLFAGKEHFIWTFSTVILLSFAVLALFYSAKLKKLKKSDDPGFFFNANSSQPFWKITWSIYSTIVGAWVLFGPAAFSYGGGISALIGYTLGCGIPVILSVNVASVLRTKFPQVSSFREYVLVRFGFGPQVVVSLIMLFNISISLLSEYTCVGSLFAQILKVDKIPIIILLGSITVFYTSCGGLFVSIVTDQAQAIFSILLLLCFAVYFSVNYVPNYSGNSTEQTQNYDCLLSLPIALFAPTIFSESFWQRVSASSNVKSLKKAGILSSVIIMIVVFALGFGGIIAYWKKPGLELSKDINVVIFQALFDGNKVVSFWLGMIITCLAVTMSESSVDSLQNALVSSIYSFFLHKLPITYSRVAVVVFNVPIIMLALQGFQIPDIYAFINLLTTAFLIPILSGLTEWADHYISGFCAIFSGLVGVLSIVIYGLITKSIYSDKWSISSTFYKTLPYVVALLSSLLGMFLWYLIEKSYKKAFRKDLKILGFKTAEEFAEYKKSLAQRGSLKV